MIRTQRNGITFEYILPYNWMYIDRKVVKIPDRTRQVGVRITYPDGTKRTILNSWYDNEILNAL